jgi:hypothetical protein
MLFRFASDADLVHVADGWAFKVEVDEYLCQDPLLSI